MLAALLTEINHPLVLRDFDYLIGPGQVLVRVLVSGICGAQLQEIRGEKGTHFPRFLGHEGCGIVEVLGAGVTKLKVGQKVVMHWRKGSGMESAPPQYEVEGFDRRITSGQVTTFSEFSVCSENRLTPVPMDTPNELCALLGCGLSTALGVMENEAQLKAGESVLIVGCGGVGLNLIRVSKMMGASWVAALEKNFEKELLVLKAGANTMFSGELSSNVGYDVIVDTTGLFLASHLLRPSGRYIVVGQPAPGASIQIANARHMFDGEGKSIKFTQGGGFNPDRDISRYVAMWKSGHLKIDSIVTHRFTLDRVNEALDAVRSGQAGRAMLMISQ